MGRPKATLPFLGQTLIEWIYRELHRSFTDIVVVAAPESLTEFALPEIGARVIHDPIAFQGPADALLAGLEAIENDVAFACSCDLPLLSADLAVALSEMIAEYDAVVPRVGGRAHPLHAVYRKRCTVALRAVLARGERRLAAMLASVDCRFVGEREIKRYDPELSSLMNVNTEAEYRAALRLGGRRRATRAPGS